MTFHAIGTTNVFGCGFCNFAAAYVLVQLFVFAIELVVELHSSLPVTVNTEAHGQIAHLLNLVHLGHVAMAFGTINLTNGYVLLVTKEDVIWQVMYLYPLDGFVVVHGLCNLIYLELAAVCSLFDKNVAIIAYVGWRNTCKLALLGSEMAVKTTDLVVAGMHLVRKLNRLIGLVILGPSQRHGRRYQVMCNAQCS